MTESDALYRVLADMRRRLGDDPDPEAVREAAAETDVAAALDEVDAEESDREASPEHLSVDRLAAAYRATFATDADAADGPTVGDHTETAANADAGDHTETAATVEGTDDAARFAGASTGSTPHRVGRVAHFRDTVRTVAEWRAASDAIGPGVFDVASDARTTEGMDTQLTAHFEGVDYEVRSYTLGPDDRHPSWTQIRLSEPVDPSGLPDDLTIRKVEDTP